MSPIDSNTNKKVEVESDLLRIIEGLWIEREKEKGEWASLKDLLEEER